MSVADLIHRTRQGDIEAAIQLADLVERLAEAVAGESAPRRGGDPHAAERAEQHAALRSLAVLVAGPDASAEQQAREIASRLGRYRPAPEETARERQLMRAVIDTGLPIPGPDRIARIIRGR